MARRSTEALAKRLLTRQEFQAWKRMIPKLSSSELKAGERPRKENPPRRTRRRGLYGKARLTKSQRERLEKNRKEAAAKREKRRRKRRPLRIMGHLKNMQGMSAKEKRAYVGMVGRLEDSGRDPSVLIK